MSDFKLDRTAFKGQTATEASNHKAYYASLSWQERIKIAAYLNSVAFDYDFSSPPRMDKTICTPRSRE